MTTIFLPPPFDGPDVLGAILPEGPGAGRRAKLPSYEIAGDGGLRIALVPATGAETDGLLVDPTEAQRQRLDFAMASLDVAAVPVADGIEAYVFRDPSAVRRLDAEPVGESRQRLIEALAEAMDQFGRRSPADMPFLMHGIGIRALGRARGRETCIPNRILSGLGADDVVSERRLRPYAHYFGIEEHRLRHRRFDGGLSPTLERAVFTSGDAVTVLPYDPVGDLVLLIEQFRAGLYARRDPRPWCLETVAGRCDRAEPPEETARREAVEEAGLELGRLERISAFYPSPGIMSEYIVSFVGEADLRHAGGTHGLAEEDEDIRSIVVPRAEALAAVGSGEVNCAPLIISLLWLEANAARLRADWGAA